MAEINLKSHYMDNDSLVVSLGQMCSVPISKKLQVKHIMFEFSNLGNRLELHDGTNKNLLGIFKKKIRVDDLYLPTSKVLEVLYIVYFVPLYRKSLRGY